MILNIVSVFTTVFELLFKKQGVGMRHTVLEPSDSNGKDGERRRKTSSVFSLEAS